MRKQDDECLWSLFFVLTVFYRKTSALNPPEALYPQAHVLTIKYHRNDDYPFMIFGLPRGIIQ